MLHEVKPPIDEVKKAFEEFQIEHKTEDYIGCMIVAMGRNGQPVLRTRGLNGVEKSFLIAFTQAWFYSVLAPGNENIKK